MRYVYHLMELWVTAVSQGGLPAGTPLRIPGIVAQQNAVEGQLFRDPDDDMPSLDAVCSFIEKHPDTASLLTLFQQQTAEGLNADDSRGSIRSKVAADLRKSADMRRSSLGSALSNAKRS